MTKGRKILKLKLGSVVLKDFFLVFQSPLSGISKSFGFDDVARKGRFPFLLADAVDPQTYHSDEWPEIEL